MTTSSPFPALEELPALDLAVLGRGAAPAAVAQARAAEIGRAEGFEVGFDEGRRAGVAGGRADVERVLGAVSDAIDRLERRDAASLAEVGPQAVELALAIAEAVIGRELAVAEYPGADAIVRALALAPDRGPVLARLHPADAATVGDAGALVPGRELEVVADPSVEPGGCLLEVGPARIDAQIGAAVQRVRDELLGPELGEDLDEDWSGGAAR